MSHYTNFAQLKAYKGPGGCTLNTDNYSDADLTGIIDLMEAIVESVTGDKFNLETETNLFDGTGSWVLFFAPRIKYRLLTVTSVTEIEEDGTVIDTLVENDDFVAREYWLEALGRSESRIRTRLFKGIKWARGVNNFSVTGTWGRATTPLEITEAVKLLAAEKIQPGFTRMVNVDILQKLWSDYQVMFKDTTSSDNLGKLTGFKEVDRLLEPHINYSCMMTLATPLGTQ